MSDMRDRIIGQSDRDRFPQVVFVSIVMVSTRSNLANLSVNITHLVGAHIRHHLQKLEVASLQDGPQFVLI